MIELQDLSCMLNNAQEATQQICQKTTTTPNPENYDVEFKKARILIAADSQGRNCGVTLRNIFSTDLFETLSFFMPNASFEEMAVSACRLSVKYTKNNYVILFAGTNNALKNIALSHSRLEQIKEMMAHTNLLIITTHFWSNKVKFNSMVLRNNMALYSVFGNHANIMNASEFLTTYDYT